MSRHHMYVGVGFPNEGRHYTVCACGWCGPARDLSDPHREQLLADDADWHLEKVGPAVTAR